MVTLDLEKQKEAHKELHKKIYDCDCKPYLEPWSYCIDCEIAVLKFLHEYGAGVLFRDTELMELTSLYTKICKENRSLSKRLEDKIKRVEELKAEVKHFSSGGIVNQDIDISSLTKEYTNDSSLIEQEVIEDDTPSVKSASEDEDA